MANHLANETSPYLLQHVDNPVDWYPWGEESLRKARKEDKPILLSIGYAACHWCHVMAHESFEDEETAQIMNQHFINIKVDREERPDLDSIYMSAVVATTGQGGWPMTVVMTPSGEPFFAGTYFPKSSGFGLPSFKQVLLSVAQAWKARRVELEESAQDITSHIAASINISLAENKVDERLLVEADQGISRDFDPVYGGFGSAPKFPQSMTMDYLLRRHLMTQNSNLLEMAELTLAKMAQGGMYDHIGGGFARYSTDRRWLVPHFEKMLYDNALLSRVYLHAWQMIGNPIYHRVVEETVDWVLREMKHEQGGFYSSLDADSEGEEGKFYVWKPAEIEEILGDEAEIFMRYYDITEGGNWEGKSIPNVSEPVTEASKQFNLDEKSFIDKIEDCRRKVLGARNDRVWPGLDNKVLTAWNGLMLAAMAEAGRVLGRADYLESAVQNAEFLYDNMRSSNGRLFRTWKEGSESKLNAYLEDYAFLADGLLSLYQSTFDSRWYFWAKELTDIMIARFSDEKGGGFFDTSDDHEELIYRPKGLQDNAVPSGNSMAVSVLLQIGLLSGGSSYLSIAERTLAGMIKPMRQHPNAFAHWLSTATFIEADTLEVAIIGSPDRPDTKRLIETLFASYDPFIVAAVGPEEERDPVPLLAQRPQIDGKASAYVCRRFVCRQPVYDPQKLRDQLINRGDFRDSSA